MKLDLLTAISPIDGRYRSRVNELTPYFSEFGLIKYRVQVEIEYFIKLCEIPLPQLNDFDSTLFFKLRKIYTDFSVTDAERVKKIEETTNHDVKAVEYFIKEKFDELNISKYKEFIHFGLTSQDINNTAIPLSLMDAVTNVYAPRIQQVIDRIEELSTRWADVPMLARTHGQPASPTRLGKELKVFSVRIQEQMRLLKKIPFSAKFGGATGNFNAHKVAYPEINWVLFANEFVNNNLGLLRSQVTTQIEHYDNLGAIFDNMKRINTIMLDLSRDMWTYISTEYFKQKIIDTEVGSSAMPHKVNPIDFENAEGNIGIANAVFTHLSEKLPVSRLQRDLTDSTVLRNIGVPLGHTLISIKSLLKGLSKIMINEPAIKKDLENNYAVVAEGIQTILRREGYPNAYEVLKELTRTGAKINSETINSFVDGLDLNEKIKKELKNITPFNYTGMKSL
jgi:adenylosuccinate lyase